MPGHTRSARAPHTQQSPAVKVPVCTQPLCSPADKGVPEIEDYSTAEFGSLDWSPLCMQTTARLPSLATVQLQTATSVRGGLIVDGHVEVSQEWGGCYMGMIKGS